MVNGVTLPIGFLDGVVKFADIASVTAQRAIDEVSVHRKGQEKAAALREPLLKYMIDAGVVNAKQEKAAEAMLAGHAETLNMLKAAIDKIVELRSSLTKQASTSGEGVDSASLGMGMAAGKQTAAPGDYNSLTDSRIGMKTAMVKESDRPLLALIGR